MLMIRFNRVGRKNKAYFRIAVQENTVAPGGRHVEIVGSHDPHGKKSVLKADRIEYWLGKGAQMSDTVYNLFVKEGVVKADKKRAVKMKRPVKVEAPVEEAAAEEVKAE